MKKILIGSFAGILIGIIWTFYLSVLESGQSIISIIIDLVYNPLTISCFLVGDLVGILSNILKKKIYIILLAIVLSVTSSIIISLWSKLYLEGLIIGIINGIIIGGIVAFLGNSNKEIKNTI